MCGRVRHNDSFRSIYGSTVEELEDTLDAQHVGDLRELCDSTRKGLVTIKETHANLRENRGAVVINLPRQHLLTTFRSRPRDTKKWVGTSKEMVHVHLESFVSSLLSVERAFRGAGACDTCCTHTVAGQEWMNEYVLSLKRLELKFWTLQCHQRFKFGACDPVVFNTASSVPVMIHGACAVTRVSVVPRKLMLSTNQRHTHDVRSSV